MPPGCIEEATIRRWARSAVAFAILSASTAAAADPPEFVTLKTTAPSRAATLLNDSFVFYASDDGSSVSSSGVLYVPGAPGGEQVFPNKHDVTCFKGDSCVIASSTLLNGITWHIALRVDFMRIVEWTGSKVVAASEGKCETSRWELDLKNERVTFYKLGNAADPKCGGGQQAARSTYMAVLGSAVYEGEPENTARTRRP